jgi:copper chaperone CopZ
MEIDGMSCGHCVASVKKALDAVAGTTVERVEVGAASVAYDPAITSPAAIESAVRDAGYEVSASRAA